MGRADRKSNMVFGILRSRKGFSLIELLVTLILVGLISAAVAGGISMIARSYTKVVDRADAEQLLSTTLNKMQDELCFARVDLEEPKINGNQLSFISGISGLRIRFKLDDTKKDIVMEYLKGSGTDGDVIETYHFTDSKLIDGGRMYVTYTGFKLEYDSGKKCTGVVINNPRAISPKTSNQVLAQLPADNPNYSVAAINYRAANPTTNASSGGTD